MFIYMYIYIDLKTFPIELEHKENHFNVKKIYGMYKNFVSRQEIHLVRQYALALIHITFCMPGFVSWKRPQ